MLGVASAIIIASCIKENGVLKELKCAAARVFAFLSMPIDTASPVLAVLLRTNLAPKEEPLSPRASKATPHCNL